MDFSYISIADTIVYQDSFTERIDNQNSLSFLNLDTLDSHRFGVPSEIEGIFNDIEAFKQLDIASWSGEVRRVEFYFAMVIIRKTASWQ